MMCNNGGVKLPHNKERMVHSMIIITDIATNQVILSNLSLLHFDGKNVNKQLMIYYCFLLFVYSFITTKYIIWD